MDKDDEDKKAKEDFLEEIEETEKELKKAIEEYKKEVSKQEKENEE